MGIFDFLKDAGANVSPDDKGEHGVGLPSAEDIDRVLQQRTARHLALMIENLGFKVDSFSVEVVEDTATLEGRVASQSDRERIVLAVGNTSGIGRVIDQLEVDNAEPESTFYTVELGDSLSKIAEAHYGNAMKYLVIFEANKPMLTDPNRIYPGQVLRIPKVRLESDPTTPPPDDG